MKIKKSDYEKNYNNLIIDLIVFFICKWSNNYDGLWFELEKFEVYGLPKKEKKIVDRIY